MENKQNSVIHLVDHINSKKEIETFKTGEYSFFDISKDNITQRKVYSFIVDMSVIMFFNAVVHIFCLPLFRFEEEEKWGTEGSF